MNAIPMIRRCATRQWQGLSPEVQQAAHSWWALPLHQRTRSLPSLGTGRTIATVRYRIGALSWISLKEDRVPGWG